MCGEMERGELALVRLKRRADFVRVARSGRRYAAPGLVLQVAPQVVSPKGTGQPAGVSDGEHDGSEAPLGIGFTASKKVGNAVARNRVKRRLRAAVAAVMPYRAAPHHDFVLIGRKATLQRPFADLQDDLIKALRRTKSLVRPNRNVNQNAILGTKQNPA